MMMAQDRSMEQQAAEELAFLLQYLELTNEMNRYLTLYRLLSGDVLDGMRVSKELRRICQSKGISFLPERMQMLSGYGDYTYMRRKWKKELRRQKKLSDNTKRTAYSQMEKEKSIKNDVFPEWKSIVQRISNFGTPLWNCLCRGELFVGDWMPELERFLD